MEYDRITVDAHSLIWYVHEPSNVKLTQKALEIIDNAENENNITFDFLYALLNFSL